MKTVINTLIVLGAALTVALGEETEPFKKPGEVWKKEGGVWYRKWEGVQPDTWAYQKDGFWYEGKDKAPVAIVRDTYLQGDLVYEGKTVIGKKSEVQEEDIRNLKIPYLYTYISRHDAHDFIKDVRKIKKVIDDWQKTHPNTIIIGETTMGVWDERDKRGLGTKGHTHTIRIWFLVKKT